jgi:hypothetical protein
MRYFWPLMAIANVAIADGNSTVQDWVKIPKATLSTSPVPTSSKLFEHADNERGYGDQSCKQTTVTTTCTSTWKTTKTEVSTCYVTITQVSRVVSYL